MISRLLKPASTSLASMTMSNVQPVTWFSVVGHQLMILGSSMPRTVLDVLTWKKPKELSGSLTNCKLYLENVVSESVKQHLLDNFIPAYIVR